MFLRKLAVMMLLISGFVFILPELPQVEAKKRRKTVCAKLSRVSCKRHRGCTWVRGYRTKKGRTVKAYCRAKGKKSYNSKKRPSKRSKKSNRRSSTRTKKQR